MTPELGGPRLWLRPLAPADRGFWCAVYTDPALMRQIGPPLAYAAAERSFRAAVAANAGAEPARAYWVVNLRVADADIGLLGLTGRSESGEAEVGALILPPWQARGHAAEAITLLAQHAFGATSLLRLHTRHAGDNPGAAGLMRKLGFTRIAADATAALGHRWELLRENWLARGRVERV